MNPIKSRPPVLLAILLGCFSWLHALAATGAESGAIKQEWEPSTLSEKTLAKVNGGVEQYQKCLNDETRTHVNDKDDSRRVSDLILRSCEGKLNIIKEAFDAEKVPGVISDRYIQSKRSRAAQQVVKVVMSAEAARSAESRH